MSIKEKREGDLKQGGAGARWSCETGGRDWSSAAPNQGMLGAPEMEEAR